MGTADGIARAGPVPVNAEQSRLAEDAVANAAGSAGGRTSASGSGARCARTTARTATPGTTSRTTTRAAGPTAGARTASPASATTRQRLCLALGAVERPRPDPQGAALRPDQRRGQSRRGRQGALLLPRRHADALVPEDALQVSAGASFPTRSWSRRTAGAARSEPEFELLDTGVFDDDRYFDVFVEYAKAGAGRHPDAGHGPQPRAGGGDAARAAAALVPQHLVVEARIAASPQLDARRRRHRSRREHPSSATTASTATATPSCCSARTRRTCARLFGDRRAPGYFKDAFHEYVVARRARRGEPERTRHQGGGALSARRAGRRQPRCGCGCA